LAFSGGPSTEKSSSLHLWRRFAALWFAVVVIGFIEGYVLLPVGLASFLGAFFLTALVVWRVAPKWLWVKRDSSVVQFNPTSNLASLSSTNVVSFLP
jgi:hypothetical protein